MNEISIANIVSILMKRIWIIAIVTILCAAIAFSYCKIIVSPVYKATTSILITNGGVITESGDDHKRFIKNLLPLLLISILINPLKADLLLKEKKRIAFS